MAKLTKNRKDSLSKFDKDKLYSLEEASNIIKDFSSLKFDSSVDIAVNLGVDPRKADQNVRGVVKLPNGTGKDVKVLALVTPDKEDEAKKAGADLVGLDEYIKKIQTLNAERLSESSELIDRLKAQEQQFIEYLRNSHQ